VKDIIRSVPLFRLLDEEELAKVHEISKLESHAAGSELFEAGDKSDSFYLVASGKVKIVIPPLEGKLERVLYLGKGKFFGEMGVIRNTPRNAAAVVHEETELLRISQEDLDVLMSMNEKISTKIMTAVMGRAAEQEETGSTGNVEKPSTLVFFSTGAGAGASFLCANLGVKIHQLTQKKVLILDMDVEGPTQHLYGGYRGQVGGIRSLFSSPQVTSDAIRGAARKLTEGVELLGGPGIPEEDAATPEIMPEVLRNARKAYDYVLIDTTSGLNPLTQALMKAADACYLTVAPNLVSVSRTENILEKVESLELGERIRLILNKFEKGRGMTPAILQQRLGKKVVGQVRYDDKLALQALNEGKPVVTGSPKAWVSVDLTRLARQALSLGGDEKEGFSLWNLFG
jgi:Flp pilus assembly CpaE family ATPase